MKVSCLKEEKLIVLIKDTNNIDEIKNFFMNNYCNNRELREDHEKSPNEMEEFKRFQGSTFDSISRRRLIEDRDTFLELIGKIHELLNEINCVNDSRDFQVAESVRSGQTHVTSQPVSCPPHPDPGGMLSRSLGMPSRREGPTSIWDTHGTSGNVFANPVASSTAPYPGGFNPWVSDVSEHTSPHVKSESQTPRKFQSSTFDTIARRRSVEDSGRLQELQNEVNCMNDSKDFQDAESVRSGNSHVTNQPGLFPKHPANEGMLRPSFVSPSRKEGPPNIWDTSGISGNVFCESTCFLYSSLSSRIESMTFSLTRRRWTD